MAILTDDELQIGEELRHQLPSIAGKAAALRERFPHLNHAERKIIARQTAIAEQFKREGNE